MVLLLLFSTFYWNKGNDNSYASLSFIIMKECWIAIVHKTKILVLCFESHLKHYVLLLSAIETVAVDNVVLMCLNQFWCLFYCPCHTTMQALCVWTAWMTFWHSWTQTELWLRRVSGWFRNTWNVLCWSMAPSLTSVSGSSSLTGILWLCGSTKSATYGSPLSPTQQKLWTGQTGGSEKQDKTNYILYILLFYSNDTLQLPSWPNLVHYFPQLSPPVQQLHPEALSAILRPPSRRASGQHVVLLPVEGFSAAAGLWGRVGVGGGPRHAASGGPCPADSPGSGRAPQGKLWALWSRLYVGQRSEALAARDQRQSDYGLFHCCDCPPLPCRAARHTEGCAGLAHWF